MRLLMPWSWGRPKTPNADGPSSGNSPTPSGAGKGSPASPLPGAARFRVEKVWSIMGKGCVVGGTVLEGVIHPPCQMKIEPGDSSSSEPRVVDVIEAVSERKPRPEVVAGVFAGLTLRGLPGAPTVPGSIRRKWEIQDGDFLVTV